MTPEQAQIIRDAIDDALLDVHVALPGKVQSYNAATKTATIQIQLKRQIENTSGTFSTEDMPVLSNVPVKFFQVGSFLLRMPVNEGDTGLIHFVEQNFGQWRATGKLCEPDDIGRHGLSGAVFVPGLVTDADAAKVVEDTQTGAVFGNIGGLQIVVEPSEVNIKDAISPSLKNGPVAMADFVDALFQALNSVLSAVSDPASAGGIGAAWSAAKTSFLGTATTSAADSLKTDYSGLLP